MLWIRPIWYVRRECYEFNGAALICKQGWKWPPLAQGMYAGKVVVHLHAAFYSMDLGLSAPPVRHSVEGRTMQSMLGKWLQYACAGKLHFLG